MYKILASIPALIAAATVANFSARVALADILLLEPPEPAYPALIDHSCGGVHTSTYVLGFDANGNISGAVHARTRCPMGSGRYRRSKTYSSWHTLVWDLHGKLLTTTASHPLTPDPEFTATDKHGNTISTRHPGSPAYSTKIVGVLTTP
jgi:hypothetical protein